MAGGINSWFRAINSVSSSVGRMGRATAKGQANTIKSKYMLVNAGLLLGGSVVRLTTKVVDYAGSKITGKPMKKRGKKSKNNNSNYNANGKPKTKAQIQKERNMEDIAAKKRLKEQKIEEDNWEPESFLDDDVKKEKAVMPSYKMTPEELEAMEQLSQFNQSNRGYDSDGLSVETKQSKMEQLYSYLERTSAFYDNMEYTEDKKAIKVSLKPLDIQTKDEFFVNFKELILSPTEIMNPDFENYLKIQNVNPSKLMTALLQDYHIERAPMLYFVINYYMKSNKK